VHTSALLHQVVGQQVGSHTRLYRLPSSANGEETRHNVDSGTEVVSISWSGNPRVEGDTNDDRARFSPRLQSEVLVDLYGRGQGIGGGGERCAESIARVCEEIAAMAAERQACYGFRARGRRVHRLFMVVPNGSAADNVGEQQAERTGWLAIHCAGAASVISPWGAANKTAATARSMPAFDAICQCRQG
jgi:hypothetical protein